MDIVVEKAVARFPEFRFRKPLVWKMKEGENWAVIGPNGAGKSLFTDVLQGKVALKSGSVTCTCQPEATGSIRSITFKDIHALSDTGRMYYQQRWNSQDAETAPYAKALLASFTEEKIWEYTRLFGIEHLLDKRIISLSSGELRKFLITKVLMSEPSVIILDNPFIGLDMNSRIQLDGMLGKLYRKKGLQTILVLSQTKDMPQWIDKVLPIKGMDLYPPFSRKDFMSDTSFHRFLFPEMDCKQVDLSRVDTACKDDTYDSVLDMQDICLKYAGQKILEGVDWKVEKGEKWALLGENGSGKSALLSLVCGDNPQAYANNMSLFGRKRGSGESIWDIKRRIGYLSADMHTYYMEDIPCIKVVASGFYDTVGLFRKCSEVQYGIAMEWMKIFHADYLAGRSFLRISFGEQRLVLLARAFVKNPELLILDEPLHGLDAGKKNLAKNIIEKFCENDLRTLIYVSHYKDEIPEIVNKEKILLKKSL